MLEQRAMSHLTPVHASAAEAIAAHAGIAATDLKVDATPRPELGDFAIGAFAAAKAAGQNPAELAKQWAVAIAATDLIASATAAGPFVNLRANRPAVFRSLISAAIEGTLVPRAIGAGQTIVLDYSSPNVSKHLAYHHIRSTMLGHALVQIFRALGYKVVGINHLGDWGTTHGKLIAAWKKWTPEGNVDIGVLNDLYVRYSKAAKEDPALEAEGRAWFKKLEDGDAEAHALWSRFKDISLAEFQTAYDILGVKFDVVKGESEYLPEVPRVLAELAAKGLSSESEGALVVMMPDPKMPPLLLKKSDDATLYATRDIPSAEYRWSTWHFARSLYVVDRGQSLHFKQLFKTLELMGHEWAGRCEHIPFGLVQIGGKKGSTKEGNVVLLKDVVTEAENRVKQLLLRKAGGETLGLSFVDFTKLATDAEWAVARRLLEFPQAIVATTPKCEPHIICHYLLELAGEFSRWFTAGNGDPSLRVLCEDPPTRDARLALVSAVKAVLAEGLTLLGIAAPDVM